jgi:hypothetical protein
MAARLKGLLPKGPRFFPQTMNILKAIKIGLQVATSLAKGKVAEKLILANESVYIAEAVAKTIKKAKGGKK